MPSRFSRVQLCATPWTVAYQALQSMGFSRQEYWSGLPFTSLGDLPNPGNEPRSPTLQADSLPAEPQGQPVDTGVDSLSFLQQIFPIQGLNPGLLHCRQLLYRLRYFIVWLLLLLLLLSCFSRVRLCATP